MFAGSSLYARLHGAFFDEPLGRKWTALRLTATGMDNRQALRVAGGPQVVSSDLTTHRLESPQYR